MVHLDLTKVGVRLVAIGVAGAILTLVAVTAINHRAEDFCTDPAAAPNPCHQWKDWGNVAMTILYTMIGFVGLGGALIGLGMRTEENMSSAPKARAAREAKAAPQAAAIVATGSPDVAPPTQPSDQKRCPACGRPAPGPFCAQCGAKVQ